MDEPVTADTTGVIVHQDVISYSPIPLDSFDRYTWAVRVEFTGFNDDGMERWAVRNGSNCLSAAGEWGYEPIPSSRTDEWLAEHRFTRHRATELASEVCHHVTWNGRTADQIAESFR